MPTPAIGKGEGEGARERARNDDGSGVDDATDGWTDTKDANVVVPRPASLPHRVLRAASLPFLGFFEELQISPINNC